MVENLVFHTPKWKLKKTLKKGFSKSLQSVYPSTEKLLTKGISQRLISKMIEDLLKSIKTLFLKPFHQE